LKPTPKWRATSSSTFYDAAVSGADPLSEGSGFAEMLECLMSNGVRTIIVESPDRFARDLTVRLAGHDMLKERGIVLIAASAPVHFHRGYADCDPRAAGAGRRRDAEAKSLRAHLDIRRASPVSVQAASRFRL
jgi:Resolvase, N terminal domain